MHSAGGGSNQTLPLLHGYFFGVEAAQAKGARRLRRFRVGQSPGPCETPGRLDRADGEAACPSSVAVLLRRVERPRSSRSGSWAPNTSLNGMEEGWREEEPPLSSVLPPLLRRGERKKKTALQKIVASWDGIIARLSARSFRDHNPIRTMKTKKSSKVIDPPRPYSSIVLDGPERAAARAMLYPVGFKPEDFKKPLIGIASTWSQVTPCNMHIDKLALEAEAGANDAGGKAIIFNTITISDGISMGSEGMKYSLVSREVIADSIETVVGCAGMDGFVAIGGCDKNMPGALIAIARLNRAAVFVYGGTILPGCITGDARKLDVVSVFEAIGAHANKRIDDREFQAIEQCAIPGPGSCGGMYTANTMASAIEALGMSLPNSSAQNAMSKAKVEDCRRAGAAVVEMLKKGIRPLDILTRNAFEN